MGKAKFIFDIIKPLLEFPDEVSIVLQDQENLMDHIYLVNLNKKDMPRVIGRNGDTARNIRELVNIFAKQKNINIILKFQERN